MLAPPYQNSAYQSSPRALRSALARLARSLTPVRVRVGVGVRVRAFSGWRCGLRAVLHRFQTALRAPVSG
eukprot:352297-Chlamydomonas_euryale.AAC.5